MLSHYFIKAIILKTSPISSPKGSAKLEKAEILQMTVDHLKMLQATGGKGRLLVIGSHLTLHLKL